MLDSLPTAAKYPFRLAMSREPTPLSQVLPKTSPRFASMIEGARVEIAQESWKISRKVGELIKHGGAGLVVDYGGPRLFGSSFRVRPACLAVGWWGRADNSRVSESTRSLMCLINPDRPT